MFLLISPQKFHFLIRMNINCKTVVIQKLRLEYCTNLSEEEWIKNSFFNETASKLYLILKKIAIVIIK